ncbi:S-layer homology domain-containing protein [Leptolyngbya sp. FACHB-711]|uniref:S-layer homology domain-containing protein n=1 Tax=unclassified Leptolyngbya TaxID=2650499 RepID=UPI001686EA81|nr:S-layer homology domain-containing protein [Leptolyngbya sp. FACHB-711]MBD1850950.1 S-layer homology domain-containing protein [Cyanobacteria bacterium FACHB-502]MBD2024252.1 S-layer homology domain-containing protein [Leptolyngbya sp. FACHB-711]
MTARPPSDPRSSRRSPLDFDEFIAVLVAFASLGTVLAWGLTRGNESFLANQPGLFPIPGLTGEQSPSSTPENDSGNLLIVPPTAEGESISPPVLQPAPSASPLPETIDPQTPGAIIPVPLPQDEADRSPETVDRSAQTAPPVSPVAASFPDVPSGYWAAPFITALAQRGDISGFEDGTFRPDQPVTRAEFATLIQNTFDQQANQQASLAFKDIPVGFWAANAIDSSVKTGFLKGFPEGTFQPALPIPRIQALAALTSGLKLTAPANPDSTLQLFRDRDQVPSWGVEAAAAATQSGLVVNHPSPDILNPNQPATRAEVAAFLYQALVSAGQVAPISSNYTVQP